MNAPPRPRREDGTLRETGAPGAYSRRTAACGFLAAVLILALNLRLALASVGPLVDRLQDDTGLSAAGTGLLTALPVLCLGLVAPVAAPLRHRWGPQRALAGCLLLLAAGAGLRAVPGTACLFLGTVLVGCAIAVGNVLLPAVVRQFFPHRSGPLTGVTTMLVSGGAALSSGTVVPLSHALGDSWRAALAFWAVPALLAALLWLGFALRPPADEATVLAAPAAAVWRLPVAWYVTLFMGSQSLLAYALMSWLPTVLKDAGLASGTAGALVALLSVASIPTALLVPVLAGRLRDRRPLACAVVAISVAGLLGLLWAPAGGAALWCCLLGLGQGGEFGLALILITTTAPSTRATAALSSMAQSVGYVLAAAGPFALGALHRATAGWTSPLVVLVLVCLPMAGFAALAARPAAR